MIAPSPIRQQLEAAMAAQQGGGPQGPASPGADQDDKPGQGPVTRDAFSYEDKVADPATACGSCEFYEGDEQGCQLYDQLNQAFPRIFGLDPGTTPQGGCKAHVAGQGGDDEQADQQGAGQDSGR